MKLDVKERLVEEYLIPGTHISMHGQMENVKP